MKPSETLRAIGQPIAYYRGLTKILGGVTATVLFSQLYYWSDKTDNPLGVYKELDELMEETGLTERELRSAREKLRSIGVVVETHKRINALSIAYISELILMCLMLLLLDFYRQIKRSIYVISPTVKMSFPQMTKRQFGNRQNVISLLIKRILQRLLTIIPPLTPQRGKW